MKITLLAAMAGASVAAQAVPFANALGLRAVIPGSGDASSHVGDAVPGTFGLDSASAAPGDSSVALVTSAAAAIPTVFVTNSPVVVTSTFTNTSCSTAPVTVTVVPTSTLVTTTCDCSSTSAVPAVPVVSSAAPPPPPPASSAAAPPPPPPSSSEEAVTIQVTNTAPAAPSSTESVVTEVSSGSTTTTTVRVTRTNSVTLIGTVHNGTMSTAPSSTEGSPVITSVDVSMPAIDTAPTLAPSVNSTLVIGTGTGVPMTPSTTQGIAIFTGAATPNGANFAMVAAALAGLLL